MASQNHTGAVAYIRRLKQEIDKLTAEQAKVLRAAAFVGMTPGEAHKYEERRKEITLLVRELVHLEEARPQGNRRSYI